VDGSSTFGEQYDSVSHVPRFYMLRSTPSFDISPTFCNSLPLTRLWMATQSIYELGLQRYLLQRFSHIICVRLHGVAHHYSPHTHCREWSCFYAARDWHNHVNQLPSGITVTLYGGSCLAIYLALTDVIHCNLGLYTVVRLIGLYSSDIRPHIVNYYVPISAT
jgi:hypothetical protein